MKRRRPDWREAVIYEIYVRSFRDSDGDGIGDLRGVIESLPYLVGLSIDAVWLTPIHPSPDRDLGYDVTDYLAVDARFGTLTDFDELIERAHEAGIGVVLDWVINHTSDQHPWFQEAVTRPQSRRRDWYVFRPGRRAGKPPTNWRSMFGGSAWSHDVKSGEWYLHTFLPEQPDLNWRNPEVRDAVAAAMRHWLARGVDGFRLDVLPLFVKDAQLRDNPQNPDWRPGMSDYSRLRPVWTVDQPEMDEVLAFLRAVISPYPDRVLLAEMGLPPSRVARYHQAIDIPLNFALITAPWTAERLERRIRAYVEALPAGACPNWVLGNHDVARVATRLGPELARAAAVLLLTLPGAATLYYGDELGLPNHPCPPEPPRDAARRADPGQSRDPERAPLPWDGSPGSGFSDGRAWIPPYPDPAERSVESQERDPESMLSLYRRLLRFRRERRLAAAPLTRLRAVDGTLVYERAGQRRYAIAARLRDSPADLEIRGARRIVLSSNGGRSPEVTGETIRLEPNEAVIVDLE